MVRIGRIVVGYALVASQRMLGSEPVSSTKNTEVEAELGWSIFAYDNILNILGLSSRAWPARQQNKSAQGDRASTKPSLRGNVHGDNLRLVSKGPTTCTPLAHRDRGSIRELLVLG